MLKFYLSTLRFFSISLLFFLSGCSNNISLDSTDFKIFAYVEKNNNIIGLTKSVNNSICPNDYWIAIYASLNKSNQVQIKNINCWFYKEKDDFVYIYEPNSFLFKNSKINSNEFTIVKSKEQVEREELEKNLQSYVIRNFSSNSSIENQGLNIVPIIINGEPSLCISDGKLLNCN